MMDAYLWTKLVHVISATVLFGTGLGTAFFMWSAMRGGDLAVILGTSEKVVRADWFFTTPSVVIQPLSGAILIVQTSVPIDSAWFGWVVFLYALAGACWVPVVAIQYRLRNLARVSSNIEEFLGRSARPFLFWQVLGVVAFAAVLALFWLMIFKVGMRP